MFLNILANQTASRSRKRMLNLSDANSELDLRVLVVAPTGRDGIMICNLLASRRNSMC